MSGMNGDLTWADIQRMEDGGPPPALSFTGSELDEMFGPNGPDEDDIAALNLAMERDMENREAYWRGRAENAEEALEEANKRIDELEERWHELRADYGGMG